MQFKDREFKKTELTTIEELENKIAKNLNDV